MAFLLALAAETFSPPGMVPATSVSRTAGVSMSNYGFRKEATQLKGYRVGSLAPPMSVSSGTKISAVKGAKYGVANRFGNPYGAAPVDAPATPPTAGFVGDSVPFVKRVGLSQ